MTTTATADIRCLADIARVRAREHGDRPALSAGGQTVTFSAFYQRAQEVAGALLAGGVQSQDRIAVIDHNGIETLEVVFGAALLNAVVVNVNWRLAPPEILQILTDARAGVIFVGPELVPAVAAVENDLAANAQIIAFGAHDRWSQYESWRTGQHAHDPGAVAAPGDAAFQLYTSGTTGLPKGAMLTTTNLLTLMANLSDELGLQPASLNMAIMPMFHIAGLGWATIGLYSGCRTVILRDVVPTEVLRTMAAEGVTHTFAVPAVIQMLLQCPEVETTETITPDGWLRTGDAGYRDANGYLYLHDRVKDLIVSGGENVYPAEVENALMRHPAVSDMAVIGVPDERWGEAVKAIVVAAPGSPAPQPDVLIAFCREQLAGYKCPKTVDFATMLPRNPSGKLLKRDLRAPYWEGTERQVG